MSKPLILTSPKGTAEYPYLSEPDIAFNPEYKAKEKALKSTPEYKAKDKVRRASPEYKATKKEWNKRRCRCGGGGNKRRCRRNKK